MKFLIRVLIVTLTALSAPRVHAEILALLNYETKPEQIVRKEGLAVIDVDPKSPSFGKLSRGSGLASKHQNASREPEILQ